MFSKEEYKGPSGLWQFGKKIKKTEQFDLFISFPNSFSAALMGFATGAQQRTGYKNEGREILLTKSFAPPKGLHRVEEYIRLLELFSGQQTGVLPVSLHHPFPKEEYLVININSEAASRRLTTAKAVEIIQQARATFENRILLIGGPKEKPFVQEVLGKLKTKTRIESLAGKTSLPQLVQVLASAKALLTTDSGPAHLANALGTQTVVLFGAGNENNTGPYNKGAVSVIRLGKLSCEPCTKNTCVQYNTPQCLELLETATIIKTLEQRINHVA